MRILVLGAAGMVGRRLVERLLADKELGGRAIAAIDAFDVVAPDFPDVPETITVTCEAGDISSAETVEGLITRQPDVIFHLAAIVSGEAEADFDKGYRINLDGTRHLLEAIRQAGEAYRPRLVFTSSIAVFGAPFEEKISDTFL